MVKRISSCYVDTSAFIAFLDRSDSFHLRFRRLFASPPEMHTPALVLAEGHGWFLRRYDRRRAIQFLAFVDALPDLMMSGPADRLLLVYGPPPGFGWRPSGDLTPA